MIALAAASALGASAAAVRAAGDGWTLNWEDGFNGTAVDANRWTVANTGTVYNNEKEYYLPSQATVANGKLSLTATNQGFGSQPYRSGKIETKAKQAYGRWEVDASLPATQGMWPAIWLLPEGASWPQGGEIDIMENKGSDPTHVSSSYHFGSSVATHQYVTKKYGYNAANGQPVSFQGSMHTYAVDWDPSRIRYYVDGIPMYTFYKNAAPISSTPMNLILNLAVGGDFGGDPDGTTVFPQSMTVDDVRVYSRNSATANLANRGFESVSGTQFGDWDEYGNGANVGADSVAANAHTGSVAAQLYGRFDGSTTNTSGLYQEIPATPGQVYQVDSWARNRPNDTLKGANLGRIKIEFVDANGTVIDTGDMTTTDVNSPTAYRQFALRRTAPANAAFVRAVLEMSQSNSAGGAVNFDDANLQRVSPTGVNGDIDLDGHRTSADLDLMLHSIAAANNAAFDVDGNGTFNHDDVEWALTYVFGTADGDTNLDGKVDFSDLLTLAKNYGRVGDGVWALGDFSGEGNVDFADLLELAKHYGDGTTGAAAASSAQRSPVFAADWALAQALAPEPAGFAALAGAILAGGWRQRVSVVFTKGQARNAISR